MSLSSAMLMSTIVPASILIFVLLFEAHHEFTSFVDCCYIILITTGGLD
jgi:hypothetical protein